MGTLPFLGIFCDTELIESAAMFIQLINSDLIGSSHHRCGFHA